eukprot:TRINITY_DN3617_c0_g1_i12.p1 TRINITY_DN3617_c0_g1~~TRINITY_DN3617_c0_g1_i12.p1  ORF type:complete len:401 (-),score=88.55 TRINITY_DN3617_c0_g1_i12:285-1487(-)
MKLRKKKAINFLTSRMMGDGHKWLQKLEERILEKYLQVEGHNKDLSVKYCLSSLDELFECHVGSKLRAKQFLTLLDLLEEIKSCRLEFEAKSLGPAKAQILGNEYLHKVDQSIIQFHEQMKERQKEEISTQNQILEELQKVLVKEKEQNVQAKLLFSQQREELITKYQKSLEEMNSNHERTREQILEMDKCNNAAKIQLESHHQMETRWKDSEKNMNDLIQILSRKQEALSSRAGEGVLRAKSLHRYKLKQKAYTALSFLPTDIANTGGTSALQNLSEVMDQMFSEYDVLCAENETLSASGQDVMRSIEALQIKHRHERTWKTEITRCMKCHDPFDYWNSPEHCRSCGMIFCGTCCANFVQFSGLMEYGEPSAERKCGACVMMYKDRIVYEDYGFDFGIL